MRTTKDVVLWAALAWGIAGRVLGIGILDGLGVTLGGMPGDSRWERRGKVHQHERVLQNRELAMERVS